MEKEIRIGDREQREYLKLLQLSANEDSYQYIYPLYLIGIRIRSMLVLAADCNNPIHSSIYIA